MSHMDQLREAAIQGFPRVSGDEPTLFCSASLIRLFSPRERG